jgi:hypothetical protein
MTAFADHGLKRKHQQLPRSLCAKSAGFGSGTCLAFKMNRRPPMCAKASGKTMPISRTSAMAARAVRLHKPRLVQAMRPASQRRLRQDDRDDGRLASAPQKIMNRTPMSKLENERFRCQYEPQDGAQTPPKIHDRTKPRFTFALDSQSH